MNLDIPPIPYYGALAIQSLYREKNDCFLFDRFATKAQEERLTL